jgi:hypothetical protein
MAMNPKLLRPRQTGYVAPDADARAYIAAVQTADGQKLEVAVAKAINAFVVDCKADGIWSAIKASCILAGARTLSGALTPLVGTAPTNNNFVTGDYNRKTGLVGNGTTKYLDSNRNNNADGQNDKHVSVWVDSVTTQLSDSHIGSSVNNAGGTNIFRGTVSTNWRIHNSTGDSSVNVANASMTNFVGLSRSASNSLTYRAAGSTASAGFNSTTPENANILVFATNANTLASVTNHADCRLRWYSIGSSMTLATLDSRLSTLFTAITAAIP